MEDSQPSETQTLRAVERLVSERIPPGWSLRTKREPTRSRRRPDAVWVLSAPDGETAEFVVEAKRSVMPRDLPDMVQQLRTYAAQPFIAAPYLSPRAQSVLAELGASFGDTTGNLRLMAARPAIFLERQGATKDLWPSEETLQSLRGRGSGRAVRALVDFRPPVGLRDLAQRAKVPIGSLSRVVDLLDRDGLITRTPRGPISNVDWAGVIRRWSRDYEFSRSNQVATYLEPRGLSTLGSKLWQTHLQYAATGAYAAQRFSPIAPARVIAIYVNDISLAADRLEVRPADTGANLWLAEPFDPVVFDRTRDRSGLTCVAPSQLVADMLTGPGREPSEAEELLAWMKQNENDWRT